MEPELIDHPENLLEQNFKTVEGKGGIKEVTLLSRQEAGLRERGGNNYCRSLRLNLQVVQETPPRELSGRTQKPHWQHQDTSKGHFARPAALRLRRRPLRKLLLAAGGSSRHRSALRLPRTQETEGQHTSKAAEQDMESPQLTQKRAGQKRQRSRSPVLPRRNIVGCRISHEWKEGDGQITQWKGTVLDQVPVKPSLYLVKYDGIDCVYGLELQTDERVLSLKVLTNKVASSQVTDARLANTIIGKAVEHLFEGEHGSKDEWRGMVLGQAPVLNSSFYITYERDPVLYMYQLLDDYREGNLRVMEGFSDPPPLDIELVDGLIGKHVEYTKDDGSRRVGMVIHQVEVKPTVHFVKFEDDFHIYVYDLVKQF